MPRIKAVLAVVVVVIAIGAMSTSAAMAAGEGWLIKGTLLTGIAKFANTSFVDELDNFTFSGTEITCSSTTLEAVGPQIESPNMASATSLVFKGCAVTSGGDCSLTSGPTIGTLPILTEVTLDGPLAVRGVIKAQKATTLATIQLEGANCAEEGKQVITGSVSWLAPAGRDERTLQLLGTNVSEASGELKVGGVHTELKGSFLSKLASSLSWSFM
jgi:hypothetical protein